jgi:hypothetical protein
MRRVAPVTLLMTATITPPMGMIESSRNDPTLRLKDYTEAFSRYLDISDELIGLIVILENSDADLSIFHKIAADKGSKKKIHTINMSTDYPANKGKGYGEFLMVDNGIQKLLDLGIIHNDSKIWKVTGRLFVLNIARLIKTAPPKYGFYGDMRDVPLIGDLLGGNQWVELRVCSFTPEAYNMLIRGKYGVGYVVEKEFFKFILAKYKAQKEYIVPRLAVTPTFLGYSGHSNISYQSQSYRFKNFIRMFGRTFVPFLWL